MQRGAQMRSALKGVVAQIFAPSFGFETALYRYHKTVIKKNKELHQMLSMRDAYVYKVRRSVQVFSCLMLQGSCDAHGHLSSAHHPQRDHADMVRQP